MSTTKKLLYPVYIPLFMFSFSRSLVLAAFPQYLAGLGAGIAVVGTVLSLRSFGRMTGDLPGGVLLGRWGIRRVTVFSFLLAIGANTTLIFARSIEAIGVLVFLGGFAGSVATTAFITIVRFSVPAAERGRALSLAGGSMRLGMLVGPVLGGVMADSFGLPSVFALRAVGFTLAMFSFIFEKSTLGTDFCPVEKSFSDMIRSVRMGLLGRRFALVTVGLSIFVLMWLRMSRNIIFPLWGAQLGLSATFIGVILSIGAVGELLLFYPAGILMDRFGRKTAGGLCIGLFSLGFMVLAGGTGIPGFVLSVLIVSLGNGFGSGINMVLGSDLAPSGAVSEFLGLWRLYGDIGGAFGPVVLGSIAGASSLAGAVLITGGLVFFGLFIFTVIAPETLRMAEQKEYD